MYNQDAMASATRPVAERRASLAWALGSLFPAAFLSCLFALTLLSAPEHDDFCFADLHARHGFVQTISIFYQSLSGRVMVLILGQLPPAISAAANVSLLSAYSLTLAAAAGLFLFGLAVATVRAWPRAGALQLAFLTFAFASTVVSATPNLRELLYWLTGLICYVPPALLTILILGECTRALDTETEFSWLLTIGMALGGLVAAMCNEFTGVWLLLILAASLLARHLFGQPRQIAHHGLIAVAIAVGFVVVVSASGNSARMEQLPNGGHLLPSLINGLRDSLIGLGRFFREPAIVVSLIAAGAIALVEPEPARPAHANGKMLALGIVATCLACCYFEYFTHRYATGFRLVERAQNEALILLLFGLMLGVRLLVRAHRRQLRERLSAGRYRGLLDPVTLPTSLALLMIASLGFSSTSSLLRKQWQDLYPYWEESVARHVLLTTSIEPVIAVPWHKWTPSLLMTADVTANADRLPNDCIARYYRKSAIYVADVPL
ncbi:hypothetical protein M2171_003691 [Bradyrhizobium japonicum USDA 38]|uniref:DUF6056 family protein n=1 Tax=Bradyrhizobium japonicum TaxID=375 RepID=UPI0003FFB2D3|nr:DUF6056 family protein [Bradyrhizobium japonicum]MCS3894558.1 hypothetical protein [Bradyrhizobium japonicum USDA 38]MCS3947072.1 hypothetical protein [Bradyrhizobium japonicum]MCW2220097.1 hypothetical protein [Bradyrhizobium japonicum]MCW2344711.1 hypothetical protein [Bradyrhizobium japonicum]